MMKRKKHIILIFIFTVVLSFFLYVAINIDPLLDVAEGLFLVEDHPKKSDIIFVPSGNPRYRLPKAVELLKAGLADKIVINQEALSESSLAFQRRYGDRFSNRALIEHIIQVEGLNPSHVIIPNKTSRSTREDFELLKDFLKKNKFDSLIVVSSWYHLRRCGLITKKLFNHEIRTYFVPANLPGKNQYISRHKRVLALFNIYLKFAYYYVTT